MTKTQPPEPAHVVLSDYVLRAIAALCASDAPPVVKLNGVLLMVVGACHLETLPMGEAFHPSHYAIPDQQWRQVGHLLAVASKDANRNEDMLTASASVNMLLDWMNLGPASYNPEEGE